MLFNCEVAVRTKEKGSKVQTEMMRSWREKGNSKIPNNISFLAGNKNKSKVELLCTQKS